MSYTLCRMRAALWQFALLSTVVSEHGQSTGPAKTVEGRGRRLVFELHQGPTSAQRRAASQRLSESATNTSRSVSARQLGDQSQRTFASTLFNYDNVQYHLKVEVGRTCEDGPGQIFEVVPDSGSSDLWIPGSACDNCKQGTARYDMSKSCSAKNLGQDITFRYGDGTVAAGTSFEDQVTIGELHVEKQFMIQVNKMEATTHMKSDGILGLAHHYDVGAERHGRTFLHTVFREHPDIPQQFSFFLNSNEKSNQNSQLVFGDGDLARHSKEDHFQYGKAYYGGETSLWLTSVWSLGWSGTGVEVSFSERGTNGAPALVDSGSSLIVLAPDIYDHLIRDLKWRFTNCVEMPEQQILSCDCPPANDLSKIPSLVINIIDDDDHQFELCMSPNEFILESMGTATGPGALGGSRCVPSLQKGSQGQPVPIIFGMTFMRSFYTNFDVENHRIGFARSVLSPLPANAQCSAHSAPLVRRGVWMASVIFSIISIMFSCYVVMLPKGCTCCAGRAQNVAQAATPEPQA